MRIRTTVEEISHEDLVDLFSTSLCGSSYLSADYDDSDIESDEDDCYEDVMAKILHKGGRIRITDFYAEGSHYGNLDFQIDENENVTYFVGFDDVKRGLEKAVNGTFNSQSEDLADSERRFARQAFDSFLSEACDFDLTYADCLMQIILFDEIIYG